MEKGTGDRIGLNLGSMLPWSAAPVIGVPLAAWITKRAGYAFWQVLPFRSVTVAGLKRTEIPVRFVEPAWNPTTFRAHFQGGFGAEGMHTKLQDPLFFPGPKKCAQAFERILDHFTAQPIYHELSKMQEGGWVEVYPGLEAYPGLRTTSERLANTAQKMGVKPYVPDLCHLRRSDDDGFNLGPWRKSLAALLPYTSLVHVQAIEGEEWRHFINGKPAELAEMLRFVQNWGYSGPFVVEFDPRATGPTGPLPWNLAENLRRVRERIEECLV